MIEFADDDSDPPLAPTAKLSDDDVQAFARVDPITVHRLIQIAHGEPIWDYPSKEKVIFEFGDRLSKMKIPRPIQEEILEMIEEAFDIGGRKTVKPGPILEAFQKMIEVGHPALASTKGKERPRDVTILISGDGGPIDGEPKRISAAGDNGR